MATTMKPERVTYPNGLHANLFFQPDDEMIQWLVNYANGRTIVDVGCGSGWLLKKLYDAGAKCIGIEPMWDIEMISCWRENNRKEGRDNIHVLPMSVQHCGSILNGLKDKALILFCRPCHSDFTEKGIELMNDESEALYITVHENLQKYDDLGSYRYSAVPVKHEGSSYDNEIVLSIKK